MLKSLFLEKSKYDFIDKCICLSLIKSTKPVTSDDKLKQAVSFHKCLYRSRYFQAQKESFTKLLTSKLASSEDSLIPDSWWLLPILSLEF